MPTGARQASHMIENWEWAWEPSNKPTKGEDIDSAATDVTT